MLILIAFYPIFLFFIVFNYTFVCVIFKYYVMKTTLITKPYIIGVLFILFISTISTAQVGINTISPSAGSMLDINSTNKGLLVPRVDIININTIDPITDGSTESLLVYNTNLTTGKGYYYWNGSIWVNLNSNDWKLDGNIDTDEDVNFVGTTDSEALTFRTNNTERFRVANGDQVLAMANGSAAVPFYSWNSDQTMGFWRSGTRQMDMVINGTSFFNSNANTSGGSNLEWTFNPGGVDLNLRVETDNNANSFFVSGEEDNIGLGTNSPNASAQLEMAAINEGLLINRVTLSATDTPSPVTSPANGLLVYNTVNASSGATEVLPGFYYWDGINLEWVAMGGTNGRDWSLEGNSGTNSVTNFLGTTDNEHLVFRTDNNERMRIIDDGRVAINETNPNVNDRFTVTGDVDENVINAYASGTGSGVYADHAGTGHGINSHHSGSGYAMRAVNMGTGIGLFAYAANTHGVYGATPYTGGVFLTAGSVGWGSGANGANGALAIVDKVVSSNSNIGIRVMSGSTTSISTSQILNVGVNTNATDLALYALTEGTSGIRESARFQTNYTGSATDSDARDMRAQLAGYTNASQQGGSNMYYGGYFYSGGNSSGSWAYAGARYGNTNYKIIGNGNVSTIVDGATKNDTKKIMFAPEAPEVLFEDYGIGKLVNGIIKIDIDPIFSNNITVNNEHPLKVFIQLEGDCKGVYVINKSKNEFTVKELQNGNSNTSFSWHIVANRKDEVASRSNEITLYENLRFPDAPSNILPKENKVSKLEENSYKDTKSEK
tara:strand:+ start:6099 stop:8429 length:2331 start_codon:yes stop_codon:yes gene_type:complete